MTTSTVPATLSDLSGSYVIDPGHTRIGFVARHAMVSKVRGAFNEFEGSAVVDGTDFTKSTGKLTIQAASIDTRNEQRDAHLRSNDFLAMEEYPQITFIATDVRQAGTTTLELTGDLTIRGVTNSVKIPFEFEGAATDPFGNLRVGFEGSAVINRKDYGITWNAALETGGWIHATGFQSTEKPEGRPRRPVAARSSKPARPSPTARLVTRWSACAPAVSGSSGATSSAVARSAVWTVSSKVRVGRYSARRMPPAMVVTSSVPSRPSKSGRTRVAISATATAGSGPSAAPAWRPRSVTAGLAATALVAR